MISFNYNVDFKLKDESENRAWIFDVIKTEKCSVGEINYIFCSDGYLHKLNQEYLKHDTYTDIISFDYSVGKELHGDIYISVDRVKENAKKFKVTVEDEIARVMIHGILHYCGYQDKSPVDATVMRGKEDFYLARRS